MIVLICAAIVLLVYSPIILSLIVMEALKNA